MNRTEFLFASINGQSTCASGEIINQLKSTTMNTLIPLDKRKGRLVESRKEVKYRWEWSTKAQEAILGFQF
jgi:hypothetical protein